MFYRLPGQVIMTSVTAGGEGTAMGIFVAIGALGKRDAGEAGDLRGRSGRRKRGMAARAIQFRMRAGQLELRGGVIELSNILPLDLRVAAVALFAQLAVVTVLVAGEASGAEPEVGAVQVFHHDALTRGGGDPLGIVAAVAF